MFPRFKIEFYVLNYCGIFYNEYTYGDVDWCPLPGGLAEFLKVWIDVIFIIFAGMGASYHYYELDKYTYSSPLLTLPAALLELDSSPLLGFGAPLEFEAVSL